MLKLRADEWDIILSRDPNRFMDLLASTILFDIENGQAVDTAKYQKLFKMWLSHYSTDRLTWISATSSHDTQRTYIEGQISALTTLPLKKSLLGETVDLDQVIERVHQLKLKEQQ